MKKNTFGIKELGCGLNTDMVINTLSLYFSIVMGITVTVMISFGKYY